MRWSKEGLIYKPDGSSWWARSHAMMPTPLIIDEKIIRVYVGSRDDQGVGRIGFIEINAENPREVLRVSEHPVLDVGLPGTFDDNGVLPSCLLMQGERLFLYYVGFQLGVKARYYMFSGLAVSTDGGTSFKRVHRVPILDRSDSDLFFRTAPFVRPEAGKYLMWYIGGSEWTLDGDKYVPVYRLKQSESERYDSWPDKARDCWDFLGPEEHGFGRPYVFYLGGRFRMFYSIRILSKGYRLGYAESQDCLSWERKDELAGISLSDEGWDSEMICFSSVLETGGNVYMFYNGNNFGESGFGYAVLQDS